MIDLGLHELRDIPDPAPVYQLAGEWLDLEFPPLRVARAAPRHNLPRQHDRFIGREFETARIIDEVVTNHLVTLTGPGGVGKTRLAIEVAGELVAHYPDGTWFVSLAGLEPAGDPASWIAADLSLSAPPKGTARDALRRHFADKKLLLVLDNCEHVVDAIAEMVEDLGQVATSGAILATSRERLAVQGERVVAIEPLTCDGAMDSGDAVALFLDRAGPLMASGALDEPTRRTVVRICERLDGLPLAIELAAAQLHTMSLSQIDSRLDQRLALRSRRVRKGSERQRTLRDVVAWSHDLLSATEQTVFRRLAGFGDGMTLDAAESVAGFGAITHDAVADAARCARREVARRRATQGSDYRYFQFETIRAFGLECLESAGEEWEVRARMLAWAQSLR